MTLPLKLNVPFETRIGEYAAKQPLSGEKIVTDIRVKGSTIISFMRLEERKKAS